MDKPIPEAVLPGVTRYYPAKSSHPGWQMDADPAGEWVLIADVVEAITRGPACVGCFEPIGLDSNHPVSWHVKLGGKQFTAPNEADAHWLAARLNTLTAAQQPDHIVDATKMVAQQQPGQAAACQHAHRHAEYDCVVCDDCGAIRTDGGEDWPVKNAWFASRDLAKQPMQQGGGEVACCTMIDYFNARACDACSQRVESFAFKRTAPPSAPVGVESREIAEHDQFAAIVNALHGAGESMERAVVLARGVTEALAQQPAAVDEAWLSKARSLYDRCSVYPETKPDGMTALLELRNHVYSILATQHQAGLADKPCPYREPTTCKHDFRRDEDHGGACCQLCGEVRQ
jgi:hypothetical protein